MFKWYENNNIGENEIHELFFSFNPFLLLMKIEIFIAKYRQLTPKSTRNRM